MKRNNILVAVALTLVAIILPPVRAADAASTASKTTDADTIVRQMSQKLGAATKLSFKVRREIGSELAGGDGLQGSARIAVEVQRPDKVAARGTIPGDERRFYYDGKQLTLVDVKKNTYATVPLASSLDKLPSDLATIYGFTFPVGEFILTDLHADLIWRAQSFEYRGTGTINSGSPAGLRRWCAR